MSIDEAIRGGVLVRRKARSARLLVIDFFLIEGNRFADQFLAAHE